jgi:hypothetical protein
MIRQMEYKSTQYKCKEDLNLNSVKEFYEDKFEQLHPLVQKNLKFINLKKNTWYDIREYITFYGYRFNGKIDKINIDSEFLFSVSESSRQLYMWYLFYRPAECREQQISSVLKD